MDAVYLDCNASTPLDPEVREVLLRHFTDEPGNAGSRTHSYGIQAKGIVEGARRKIATAVTAREDEVIFTSGATESNNIAICGLGRGLGSAGHVITTAIEHKAVLEPMRALEESGFSVTRLEVGSSGVVDPEDVRKALRPDTVLVSVMQANNETGIRQPLDEIANILAGHPAYLHTDAAQGFAWQPEVLTNPRIDLISLSGHKVFAPQGIGALIARRRGYVKPPLKPLSVGGGQERGLRAGTHPVALVGAFGRAAELAVSNRDSRKSTCRRIRETALTAFSELGPMYTGDQTLTMDHVLNLRFRGVNSEALMVALKDLIAVSNGSACTSTSYVPSHVLLAMGMSEFEASCCIRVSWCHLTPEVPWTSVVDRIRDLL